MAGIGRMIVFCFFDNDVRLYFDTDVSKECRCEHVVLHGILTRLLAVSHSWCNFVHTRRWSLRAQFVRCFYRCKAWFVTIAAASFPLLPVPIFMPLLGISKCDTGSRETSGRGTGRSAMQIVWRQHPADSHSASVHWIALLCLIISARCRLSTVTSERTGSCRPWVVYEIVRVIIV
jgi:hypothetical protein